jgi:3-deoxy-D-manno-octulosonic-acid transferase
LIYFFYSLLLAAGMLLSLPYWIYHILRHGKYRTGFFERMGRVPARLRSQKSSEMQRTIWIHAVSVGEVLAVAGLLEKLRSEFPEQRIVVTTTTDTGQALARKRFGEDAVFYFPTDFSFAIRPYLRALRPELIILAETEFWPNFLRLAHKSGAHIAVVNARISDRSLPRYRRFRWALRKVLANIDLFLAQTEQDRERLRSIGAASDRVCVTGNLKFDRNPPVSLEIVERLRASFTVELAGPVLVCGSTVEGEEQLLLKAFENVLAEHARAVMVLAPRHPERFKVVTDSLTECGVRFVCRSHWQGESLAGGVLLLDSIGELGAMYGLADVSFVGGSLVPRGGHNIIEPAQHGTPIVVGEYTENFRDIVGLFQKCNAVRVVTPSELARTFLELLTDPAGRSRLGRRAQETVQSQKGATCRTIEKLKTLIAHHGAEQAVSAGAMHIG